MTPLINGSVVDKVVDPVIDEEVSGCFRTLQAALAAATANETIWIAPATYNIVMPSSSPLNVPEGVTLIGDESNRGLMPSLRVTGRSDGGTFTNARFLSLGNGASIRGIRIEAVEGITTLVSLDAASQRETTIAFCDFKGRAAAAIRKDLTSAASVQIVGTQFEMPVSIASSAVLVSGSRFNGTTLSTQGDNVTITASSFFPGDTELALIMDGASGDFSVSDNVFVHGLGSCVGALSVRGVVRAVLRRNTFASLDGVAVSHEGGEALDMGLQADAPGDNIFLGNTIDVFAANNSVVSAIGNTWSDAATPCNAISGNGTVVLENGANCSR